jgi:hypothetical protein
VWLVAEGILNEYRGVSKRLRTTEEVRILAVTRRKSEPWQSTGYCKSEGAAFLLRRWTAIRFPGHNDGRSFFFDCGSRVLFDLARWILREHGYETAVKGKNGFVCVVERLWMLPYDDPEFWDPNVRLPLCLNPPAARSRLCPACPRPRCSTEPGPRSPRELPVPEPGSMCYMMSKRRNLGPKSGNVDPHLMFWFPQKDHMNWGADFPGSPLDAHQFSPQPITEFDISVSKRSDGTTASK